MRRTESEAYINNSIHKGTSFQVQILGLSAMPNTIIATSLLGQALEGAPVLTLKNGIIVLVDIVLMAGIGCFVWSIQRRKQYLRVISAAMKSDDSFTIPGDQKDFDDSLGERTKRYFKTHKRKEVDTDDIF